MKTKSIVLTLCARLGFDAVALNTSNPKRVVQNAHYGAHRSPESFWSAL